jgi:periplasmic mercuric ion binding protein
MRSVALASIGLLFAWAGVARAETKVELKGVHLCCPQCVKAVAGILKEIEGVKGACDQKNKTVTITAKDNETAQKAVDALAAGGFHGDTGNKDVAVKDDSGVTAGKVKSVTVTGVHNCCGQCNGLIKKALKGVEGVKGDTCKAKAEEFEVTGDFDAADVVKALNAAGFHVKVKK